MFGIWDCRSHKYVYWSSEPLIMYCPFVTESHQNTELLVCMTCVISPENPPNHSIISERKKRLSGISAGAHTTQVLSDTAYKTHQFKTVMWVLCKPEHTG